MESSGLRSTFEEHTQDGLAPARRRERFLSVWRRAYVAFTLGTGSGGLWLRYARLGLIATSLDGFIARPDGALDWLPVGGGEPHSYNEFMATVDALVIGRQTFEIVVAFDVWPCGSKPVVVLSTTMAELKVPEGAVCELMAGTPDQIVARLGARGIPLFGPLSKDIRFEHLATRSYPSGMVQSEYVIGP